MAGTKKSVIVKRERRGGNKRPEVEGKPLPVHARGRAGAEGVLESFREGARGRVFLGPGLFLGGGWGRGADRAKVGDVFVVPEFKSKGKDIELNFPSSFCGAVRDELKIKGGEGFEIIYVPEGEETKGS